MFKDLTELTLKELTAMGYKITVEAPPSGKSRGVHLHVPRNSGKQDYQAVQNAVEQLIQANPQLNWREQVKDVTPTNICPQCNQPAPFGAVFFPDVDGFVQACRSCRSQ